MLLKLVKCAVLCKRNINLANTLIKYNIQWLTNNIFMDGNYESVSTGTTSCTYSSHVRQNKYSELIIGLRIKS